MSYKNAKVDFWLQIHAVPVSSSGLAESILTELLNRKISWFWDELPGATFRNLCSANQLASGASSSEVLVSCWVSFSGDASLIGEIASRLRAISGILFEISYAFSGQAMGERMCYTPSLGLYRASLDECGNQVFNENQLASLLAHRVETTQLEESLRQLLGVEWDIQLEPLRSAKAVDEERQSLAS
jgi:hypothetical protein